MQNANHLFLDFLIPTKVLLVYTQPDVTTDSDTSDTVDVYVESCDIDPITGLMINHHPLAVQEALALGKRLNAAQDKINGFLLSKGILPDNVLYVNPRGEGKVIWYTQPTKRTLFFSRERNITDGTAHVPGMLWCASATQLYVFALKPEQAPDKAATKGKNATKATDGFIARPSNKTPLFAAPFYNSGASGYVCQGDVKVEITKDSTLDEFMRAWEQFYFNSRFSHLSGSVPIRGNVDELWRTLINTETLFPLDVLLPSSTTLSSLTK